MKVVNSVRSEAALVCAGCSRPVRTGEFVLYHRQKVGHLLHTFVAHVECVERKVETSPFGTARREKSAFEQLRNRILATGKAFPDGDEDEDLNVR